jgi:hypothetical protein
MVKTASSSALTMKQVRKDWTAHVVLGRTIASALIQKFETALAASNL